MKLLIRYLFDGHLNTLPFEPENSKDPSKLVIKAIHTASNVISKKSQLIGDLIYMEEGFLLMDGNLSKEAFYMVQKYETEDLSIENDKGHKLVGKLYKASNSNKKYALLIHGYRMTGSSEWLRYIPYYLSLGVNVITVDSVGAGESEGDYVTFGIQESKDVIRWINYINKKYNKPDLLLHGDSMGASTVLLTSAMKDLPRNVKFVVADSGYSSAYDEFSYILNCLHLPSKLIYTLLKYEFLLKSGYNLENTNVAKAITKSKTPTLFIHGKRDVFVPFEQGLKNYNACGAKDKELCEFETASHCQAMFREPDRYFKIIGNWINKYMN